MPPPFVSDEPMQPLATWREYSPEQMLESAKEYYEAMKRRRTVREFSDRSVDRSVIDHALLAAGTAPNGANMQPWHFVVVSDPAVKAKIPAGR